MDVGFSVYGSREAQAMADTGALDMARYINIADVQASPNAYLQGKLPNVVTDNASNANLTVTDGLWLGGAWSIPALGCAPLTPPALHPCNAVMVTATQAVPQLFWGSTNTLTARSTIAAVTPESGFSIGSFLANFNTQQSAVLNTILSQLGTSANVTAVGYQGLANTYVTVNQLITASGGLLTPSNVMTVSLTGAQWLAIWSDAVANQVGLLNCGSSPTPPPCNASTALTALDFSSSTSAQLCQLVSVNGSIVRQRVALDARPLGQPRRGADPDHRGGAGQRDQRAQRHVGVEHPGRDRGQPVPHARAATPGGVRPGRHDRARRRRCRRTSSCRSRAKACWTSR